jgi:signal transduction histidine kinase
MQIEAVSSLGLKLVRVLAIEQLEGTLRLESNPGAAFHIYFRVDPVAAADLPAAAEPTPGSGKEDEAQ